MTAGGVPHAVIVGLDSMQGLQAARILAGHGVPITALATDVRHYACRTNVCERIIYADTRTEDVISVLENEADDFSLKPVLIPCDDGQVEVISRFRHRLESSYHVPLPRAEVIDLMLDKVNFYNYARDAGLPIPRTMLINTRADAQRAAEELSFPVVVKPPSKTGEWSKHTAMKAYKLLQPEEFMAFYDDHEGWTDILIAQEWVEGPDSELYSCNAYFNA